MTQPQHRPPQPRAGLAFATIAATIRATVAGAVATAVATAAMGMLLPAALAQGQMIGAAFDPTLPASVGRSTESYVVFDALYMQRNSDKSITPGPLVLNTDTQAAAIGPGDLQFPVAPGYRVLVGTRATEDIGWEVGSLGVYSMFADAIASGSDNLQIPPPLGEKTAGLRAFSAAQATYGSVLNSVEANAILTRQYVHLPHFNAYPYDAIGYAITVDWMTGFRWAGLDETAALALGPDFQTLDTLYSTRTSSNLFGWQLGVRGRVDWERWALEGVLKGALAGASVSQSQGPIVDPITGDVIRPGNSAQTANVGGIFELGTSLVYRLSDVWGLRVGYSMLWLTGVALAPNQFDFSTNGLAATTVDTNNTLWLGGGSVGLEARW